MTGRLCAIVEVYALDRELTLKLVDAEGNKRFVVVPITRSTGWEHHDKEEAK